MYDFNNFLKNFFSKKTTVLLAQFFLIIFVYHILKDLKDSLLITASPTGAKVIPFIKVWVILPASILMSMLFSKVYSTFGRNKTLCFFIGSLVGFYCLFAFFLFPHKDQFELHKLSIYLSNVLPKELAGFIVLIRFWPYTLFYLFAEMWSIMIISVLFWGSVNQIVDMKDIKGFFPICIVAGNIAGICSGIVSRYMSYHLSSILSWDQALQIMIVFVAICAVCILFLNQKLPKTKSNPPLIQKKSAHKFSFKDSIVLIAKSWPLICIAILVVGFSLSNNLIEVPWKQSIKHIYPTQQSYNAYINQVTTWIGILAVLMSLFSQFVLKKMSWKSLPIITPCCLLITSSIFFGASMMPPHILHKFTKFFSVTPAYFIMTVGSLHYIAALTFKYSLFDMSKEISFFSVNKQERIQAKSVIDTVGSRLGKSGASCLHQVVIVLFTASNTYLPIIATIAITVITLSIMAGARLGNELEQTKEEEVA